MVVVVVLMNDNRLSAKPSTPVPSLVLKIKKTELGTEAVKSNNVMLNILLTIKTKTLCRKKNAFEILTLTS